MIYWKYVNHFSTIIEKNTPKLKLWESRSTGLHGSLALSHQVRGAVLDSMGAMRLSDTSPSKAESFSIFLIRQIWSVEETGELSIVLLWPWLLCKLLLDIVRLTISDWNVMEIMNCKTKNTVILNLLHYWNRKCLFLCAPTLNNITLSTRL